MLDDFSPLLGWLNDKFMSTAQNTCNKDMGKETLTMHFVRLSLEKRTGPAQVNSTPQKLPNGGTKNGLQSFADATMRENRRNMYIYIYVCYDLFTAQVPWISFGFSFRFRFATEPARILLEINKPISWLVVRNLACNSACKDGHGAWAEAIVLPLNSGPFIVEHLLVRLAFGIMH